MPDPALEAPWELQPLRMSLLRMRNAGFRLAISIELIRAPQGRMTLPRYVFSLCFPGCVPLISGILPVRVSASSV